MKVLLTSLWSVYFFFCLGQKTKIDFTPICSEDDNNPIISNWQTLGPFEDAPNLPQNIGLVACFVIHPTNSNIVFLGSNTGGMYKTENFLDSMPLWKNVTNSMRLPGIGISQIVINPRNSNIMYASTGYSSGLGQGMSVGVIKSIDGGTTWFPIGPNFPKDKNVPTRISLDWNNPKHLFYTAVDQVFESFDEGKNWKIIFQLPNSKGLNKYHKNRITRCIVDLEQSYASYNIWFISTDYSGSDESADACLIYKTTDAGKTWKQLSISKTIKTDKLVLGLSALLTKNIWLTYSYKVNGKQLNKIMRSMDEGENWIEVSSVAISGTGYHRQDIELSPNDTNVLYLGGYYVNKSSDGGKTFTSLSKGLHVDTRYLKILKNSQNQDLVLLGNDGGIAFSDDNFNSWKNKNGKGLNIKQFNGIGVGNRSDRLIVGGTQDNDICIFDGKWSIPQLTNDGADAIVNNQDETKMFAEPWCCDASQLKVRLYEKSKGDWKITSSISPPEKEANNLRPIDQFEHGTVVIAHHDVWKSSPTLLKWQKVSDFSRHFPVPLSAKIKSMAICRKDTNKLAVLYSGPSWSDQVNESYVLVSKKGGGLTENEWEDVTQNLPAVVPRWVEMNCIAFDQNNERDLYIGMNFVYTSQDSMSKAYPYNGQWRVIRSRDFGQTWEDYSNNLPPYPIQDIISEEGVRGGLYVATDVGVFYTNSLIYKEFGWVCFNTNLPVGIVMDLEINYCNKKLIAGTFGHGVWLSELATSKIDFLKKEIIELKGDQMWTFNKDLNTDVYLKKNSKLTIKNASIAMATETGFYIEEGAELILDNSKLGNLCGDEWMGVQFITKKRWLFKNQAKGKLILLNHGEVLD